MPIKHFSVDIHSIYEGKSWIPSEVYKLASDIRVWMTNDPAKADSLTSTHRNSIESSWLFRPFTFDYIYTIPSPSILQTLGHWSHHQSVYCIHIFWRMSKNARTWIIFCTSSFMRSHKNRQYAIVCNPLFPSFASIWKFPKSNTDMTPSPLASENIIAHHQGELIVIDSSAVASQARQYTPPRPDKVAASERQHQTTLHNACRSRFASRNFIRTSAYILLLSLAVIPYLLIFNASIDRHFIICTYNNDKFQVFML